MSVVGKALAQKSSAKDDERFLQSQLWENPCREQRQVGAEVCEGRSKIDKKQMKHANGLGNATYYK